MDEAMVKLFAQVMAASGQGDGDSDTDERILDAALWEIGAHGAKGATIDAIATRAGVGRITVFRRFGSKDELVQRLMVREVRGFLDEIAEVLGTIDDPLERIAETFARCIGTARDHPLAQRMARQDPATAFAALAVGRPSVLDLALPVCVRIIEQSQRDHGGNGDPTKVAEILIRVVLAYVLLPANSFDEGDDVAVRHFARRMLGPIVALAYEE